MNMYVSQRFVRVKQNCLMIYKYDTIINEHGNWNPSVVIY